MPKSRQQRREVAPTQTRPAADAAPSMPPALAAAAAASANGSNGAAKKADRQTEVFQRTKLCKFHLLGVCLRGADCKYAHDVVELQAPPDLFRTKLCKSLVQTGSCNEPDCRYAHSKEELRAMPSAVPGRAETSTTMTPSAVMSRERSSSDSSGRSAERQQDEATIWSQSVKSVLQDVGGGSLRPGVGQGGVSKDPNEPLKVPLGRLGGNPDQLLVGGVQDVAAMQSGAAAGQQALNAQALFDLDWQRIMIKQQRAEAAIFQAGQAAAMAEAMQAMENMWQYGGPNLEQHAGPALGQFHPDASGFGSPGGWQHQRQGDVIPQAFAAPKQQFRANGPFPFDNSGLDLANLAVSLAEEALRADAAAGVAMGNRALPGDGKKRPGQSNKKVPFGDEPARVPYPLRGP